MRRLLRESGSGRAVVGAFAIAALGVSARASAQDAAPPIEGGSTDRTKLSGQLGGSWSSGNSKSYSSNTQVRVSHRRGMDEVTWSGIVNYGRAAAPRAEDERDPDAPEHRFKTDSLYYTRLRYDRFLSEHNALFVGGLVFRDTSSGFRARYSPYGGFQHTWIATGAFELWTDIGYRAAHEILFLDRKAREDGFGERRWVHGPLLTLGTSLELNTTLDLDVALEAQQAVNREQDFRVFAIANLFNRVGKGFALGMNFNARYHREPIGAREPLDTQLQVVGILDHSFGPKK
ncbi:MAG: DUF481 domain-containing protein [Deltaproteobacteria bacterium]|nr:DUF481 domain-containing protein [Deltaproteobacteria bacterium]